MAFLFKVFQGTLGATCTDGRLRGEKEVAVESMERFKANGFRDAAERIRAEAGQLLPGVEYSEGGDAYSLSFPTEVKPKKQKK